jgi:hypothetical protein
MINGHSIVFKKPAGQIKIIINHITPGGKQYVADQVFDYYSINTTNSCNCSNNTPRKFFRIKGGLIPYEKAIIIK